MHVGAASANTVAQVGNSTVFAATDSNNGSVNFYYEGIGSPNRLELAPGDRRLTQAPNRRGRPRHNGRPR
ncbi:MAG: hypothetical protein ACRDPY_29765 [Streptosporangiaceae bacterium]